MHSTVSPSLFLSLSFSLGPSIPGFEPLPYSLVPQRWLRGQGKLQIFFCWLPLFVSIYPSLCSLFLSLPLSLYRSLFLLSLSLSLSLPLYLALSLSPALFLSLSPSLFPTHCVMMLCLLFFCNFQKDEKALSLSFKYMIISLTFFPSPSLFSQSYLYLSVVLLFSLSSLSTLPVSLVLLFSLEDFYNFLIPTVLWLWILKCPCCFPPIPYPGPLFCHPLNPCQ